MKILEIITEAKTQRAEAPKPRNFVAKNAINTGAGAHKDKKKAAKQGDVKHKSKQFAEGQVDEISDKALQNYRQQAHYAVQGHKFGSKKDNPNAAAIIAKREKGMDKAGDKIIARKKAEEDKRLLALIAKLPELKAEYEKISARYKALGGSNWQYADREQNLSAGEREARSLEGPMNNLWRQISAAEKAQKAGLGESATAGATSAGNMAVGAVYPNKKGKTYKNKDGTVKNALDVKGANLMTGGSIKR